MITHSEKTIASAGYIEVGEPSEGLPSVSRMSRIKAHTAFRLNDGLWHFYRHTDPTLAAVADAEMDAPMLPRPNTARN
jgi:hypothetical protein